jgi:hypothetical protein
MCMYIQFWPTLLVHAVSVPLAQGKCEMCRIGQNRIYTPYMTVYLVISLPKLPYIHRIYMVLANPRNVCPVHTTELPAPLKKDNKSAATSLENHCVLLTIYTHKGWKFRALHPLPTHTYLHFLKE